LGLLPGSIYGDESGLGCVMCDALKEAGWRINRVNNGSSAKRSDIYMNLGTEIWFEAARRIKNREFILPDDAEFIRQATDRGVEYTANQRLRAESKADMRSRGVSSPDRADAVFGVMLMSRGGYGGGAIRLSDIAGIKFGVPGGRLYFGEPFEFGEETLDEEP